MLLDILKDKKCFKLILGAGNEDVDEVEKLVTLYSKAGCNFFDLCPKQEIIDAAKRGIKNSSANEKKYLCISLGTKNDPHFTKAKINNKLCKNCGKCLEICPQGAISKGKTSCVINKIKCIGCQKCIKICGENCIKILNNKNDIREILSSIKLNDIDCIELHSIGACEKEVFEKWDIINSLYKGVLSICADRTKLGDELLKERIKKMLSKRPDFSTVNQADGAPMSGGKDDFKTTLQAVATAEIIQNENFPAYLILSGGTNSKSTELAKTCDISVNGVAIGSYARKIVKEYIEKEDFLKNEKTFSKALLIAKNLVETSIKNIL